MNDVEARQRKLVQKHQKAKMKEEDGDDEKSDDDEKKPSPAPTPAPKLVEKPVKVPEMPVQKVPSIFVDQPAPAQKSAAPPSILSTFSAPSAAPQQSEQSNVVQKTLEAIKKNQEAHKEMNMMPAPFVDAQPAPFVEAQPAPAPFVDSKPAAPV